MNLRIEYDTEHNRFTIDTGGVVVPAISEWLGWRRLPGGKYAAAAWPSSVLSVAPSPSAVVTWSPEATWERDRLVDLLNMSRLHLTTSPLPKQNPTERQPRLHQRQAVNALRAMGWRALLADDMGLGKTSSALWAAHDAGVFRLLVVCPVSVKFNWQNEIKVTLGGKWLTQVINGNGKHRADLFAEVQNIPSSEKLAIIINYDLLLHLTDDQKATLIVEAGNAMVLFDESHYVKSRIAKRTIECQAIAAQAKHVLCLTGTPIRNLADDLFTQVEMVRPGTWTSYRDFAKRYLVIQSVKFGKRDVQKIVGTKNITELNAVMNTLQIKRSKSEAVDLPPKVRTFPELELEGDLLKLYKAMKEFARIELSKLTGAAPMSIFDPRAKSAVEQAMRCEQIAQGFIGGIPDPVMARIGSTLLQSAEKIPGRPNELIFPEAPKLIWLLETIECVLKQGGAPLVFSRFNAPMFWLNRKLCEQGYSVSMLHGALSAEHKAMQVTSFQDGGTQMLLAQVKMAEGWNAHRSQDVLFLGRDWSPAINAQAEDRAHRMGQKGTVNVQVPIVRGTIEVMLDKRLAAKDADAMQALRSVTIEELMEAL